MTTLSIIIPYFETKKYTDELLRTLSTQIRDRVEVILIDDGSSIPFESKYEWLRVIRQKNGGVSAARNTGLDAATGEFVAFIDSDDMVSTDYVDKILIAIKTNPDYIELSWRSLNPGGIYFNFKVTSSVCLSNPSVCTRVFRRSFIGDLRFPLLRDAGEDEYFTRHLDISRGKRGYVTKQIYFYRTEVEGSAVKKFAAGLCKTKRIVYYIPTIGSDRTDLLAEIRAEDERNEVVVLTNENYLTKLSQYCQIKKPVHIWAHELRGEATRLVEVRELPLKTQVVIYIDTTQPADGISSFIYNFCAWMHEYYDIVVVHDSLPIQQIDRLKQHVRTIKNNGDRKIICDTLLLMRIAGRVPKNIVYKKVYQVIHCVKSPGRELTRPIDQCIFVSETSRNSFDQSKHGKVIYNLSNPNTNKCALFLVSTCRIGATDKGQQDARMIKLARMLDESGIEYVWLYFAANTLHGAPRHMIRMDPVIDVTPYLMLADYLVALSDEEAYCYSITEALACGTPVITVDRTVLHELGFADESHGYIIPKDMQFNVHKLLHVPTVSAIRMTDDNRSVEQWRDLLGDTEPTHDYKPDVKVDVEVIRDYQDMELDRLMIKGQRLAMWHDRAIRLSELGFVFIPGEE